MCRAIFFDSYFYCVSFHDPKLNDANVTPGTSSHVSHITVADCRELISSVGWHSRVTYVSHFVKISETVLKLKCRIHTDGMVYHKLTFSLSEGE